MATSSFFDNFPKIDYDPTNRPVNPQYEKVTNIFFRIAYLKDILKNIAAYQVYELQDTDTPERLAENIYGDAGANWMIIYANQIIDPQWDWPLGYNQFVKYVAEKYRESANVAGVSSVSIVDGGVGYSNGYVQFEGGSGSGANCRVFVDSNGMITNLDITSEGIGYYITQNVSANVVHLGGANANISVTLAAEDRAVIGWTQRNYHHFEKVLTRIDDETGTQTEWTFEIDEARLTENDFSYYEYYTIFARPNSVFCDSTFVTIDDDIVPPDASDLGFDDGLPLTQEVYTFPSTGKTVTEIVNKRAVTFYDYELKINDNKRIIKVVKRDYYHKVMGEFADLTGSAPSYLRSLPRPPQQFIRGLT